MTRINNEQTDLTDEALNRALGYKKVINNHIASETDKTKEMKEKYLKWL